MTRLQAEYRRLYLPPHTGNETPGAPSLIGRDGRVRTMVLALRRPADWDAIAVVWRGVQADLEWPAPAIAINGVDAFELWFSLAEAVPLDEASAVLQGLCRRYLPEVKPQRLRLWPDTSSSAAVPPLPPPHTALIPAQHATSEGWSAFVAPDLPAVFADDPSLDFQPGADAQAELLSRLASIPVAGFQAALAPATPGALAVMPRADAAAAHDDVPARILNGASHGPHAVDARSYQDPKQFLLDVLNDPSVALALRIDAAKALLPCAGGDRRG